MVMVDMYIVKINFVPKHYNFLNDLMRGLKRPPERIMQREWLIENVCTWKNMEDANF